MLRRVPLPLGVFAVWTLFVWVQRIVNIARDDAATGFDLVRAVVFVVVGLAVATVAVVPAAAPWRRPVVLGAAAVTTVLWAIQMVGIPLRDHDTAFVVVHLVLGVVSISLAAWAARAVGLGRVRPVAAG